MPNKEGNPDGIGITELDFPERKEAMINHTGNKRYGNSKERYEDDSKSNVVHLLSRKSGFRHQKLSIGRVSFQFYRLMIAQVKITN